MDKPEMTLEEINKEIDRVQYRLFIEEMADFMNWQASARLEKRLEELKKLREEMIINGDE